MKGDFTRFTHDPRKHYTRVLKQQGRVDLDADWNEAVEIFTRRDRIEATDVIGRCGAPLHDAGFAVEATPDGADLTVGPGRLWVDGILCEREGPDPVSLTEQEDLPGYELPTEDGIYLAYVDVWDRHVTHLVDPDIREVALGGPDTTTRTRTVCQVRLLRIADDGPLEAEDCRPFPADPSTGRLTADAPPGGDPANPCAVPEGAGYTGLENRLYRIEIHDDGRDEEGAPGARPVTWKWSRDNGSVVLPVSAEDGIDGDTVILGTLGPDEVLTVQVGDHVEVLGDETELHGRPGTIGRIVPDGIDRADLQVELDTDVSAHAAETHLVLRRWDHHETDDLALIDGALPIPAGPFELEDGVFVEFEVGGTYHTGDYWVVPARTRQGTVLWPREGTPPAPVPLPPLGIRHHYCTLALVRRTGGAWAEPRDCRPFFPPLTEVDGGGCCLAVDPGDDVQQAIDTVVAAGGGCVCLCEGVHEVAGPLRIRDAVDVCLHGEGAASVLRFTGTGERGLGGLVIENGRRIAVEDLFLVSGDVPALVSVRHGPAMEASRQVALRRLVLLNLRASGREAELSCGVRLGHTDGVRIDECRIAAEVGVLALWGNRLPDPSAPPDEEEGEDDEDGGGAPAVLSLDFDEVEAGTGIEVGDSLVESGVEVTGEPFELSNGELFMGDAVVRQTDHAGGSGRELQVSNIRLAFTPPVPYRSARVSFADLGGSVNLRVNGELRNVEDLSDLEGEVVGGVRVAIVTSPDDPQRGSLRLDRDSRSVESFAIGGQEFFIDDVGFRGPDEPATPEPGGLEYGAGVRDLRMRDSTVRFGVAGVLAARAEAWRLDRADLRPYDLERWNVVRDRYAPEGDGDGGPSASDHLAAPTADEEETPEERSARARARGVLAALEAVFASPGAPRGHALLAFRWQRCAVRHSLLAGRHGARVWWWLGGALDGCEVAAEESGAHAFWLYEADWVGSTVVTTDGLALSFAGSCRARLEHDRLRGPVGVADLPFPEALDGLEVLARAILRGYGADTPDVVLGILFDESFDLMGLGPVMDALQPFADEAGELPGVPAAWYLAPSLLESLRARGDAGLLRALPIVDLRVMANDVACDRQGVALDGFLPLGSIRVADNRIHTTTGQAVRIETGPFYANAHLTVFLVRIFLRLLVERVAEARDEAGDGPLAPLWSALATLLETWREGAEALFDLDFRVEGNTIRSLRTAIESNLFELAVLTNHVTMQERPRPTGPSEPPGAVFGQVSTVQGTPLGGATVRAVGTPRVVVADQSGQYRMPGLPPGPYTLRATRAGFSVAEAQVTLEPGEQVEVDFTLSPIIIGVAVFDGTGFSDAVVGAGAVFGVAGNPEVLEVVRALSRSPALEPLAVALREGAHTQPEAYAGYLAAEAGPLASAELRDSAADAVAVVRGQTSDAELREASERLETVLRENDRTAFVPALVRFIRGLQLYTDSRGIRVGGLGVRVVENQVVVPEDAREETEALGGIQLSVNLAYVAALALLGQVIGRYFGGNDDDVGPIDPLLGVTDTLIDTNEVVGGVGHGISVQGVAGQPDFVSSLFVRGNQVRGMAGAGLFVNEHALVVGLEVAGNTVSACGRDAGFTQEKGGVKVRTAAVCAFRGNTVVRCGEDVGDASVYGVDLDSLYGLRFTDNDVQANGSSGASAEDGGVRLVEVYGATLLHDNVVAFNRGLGLSWINSARQDEPALLPPFLMQAVNAHLRTNRTVDQLVEEEQASIRGNVLKSASDTPFPVFQLLNLREVSFSGNTCHAQTGGTPLGEIQMTARGVVSGNQTQASGDVSIAIKKMAEGVVHGNVGNRPIQLQASAAVQSGFNVPPVI